MNMDTGKVTFDGDDPRAPVRFDPEPTARGRRASEKYLAHIEATEPRCPEHGQRYTLPGSPYCAECGRKLVVGVKDV